jgi:hypothetical protein
MDGIATVVNVFSWKKICILKSQRTLREKYNRKKIKKQEEFSSQGEKRKN